MKSKTNKILIALITCILFVGSSYSHNTAYKSETSIITFQKKKITTSTSIQCKAKAKSTRRRCRNITSNASGYCRMHGG
jgi:hypothetical protein